MAQVQKGTTLLVGFGSYVYSGYIPETITVTKPDGNVEVHRDVNGATMTKILMDPCVKINMTTVISTGSAACPAEGTTVTLTPPEGTSVGYYAGPGCSVAYAPGATKLTLDLIKEASMTYA